eukprot:7091813-Karenia_brevis.AAC.1
MGVARFNSVEGMWRYKRQELELEYQGKEILRFVDKPMPDDANDAAREKAVRKVVRTIIECNGGKGSE